MKTTTRKPLPPHPLRTTHLHHNTPHTPIGNEATSGHNRIASTAFSAEVGAAAKVPPVTLTPNSPARALPSTHRKTISSALPNIYAPPPGLTMRSQDTTPIGQPKGDGATFEAKQVAPPFTPPSTNSPTACTAPEHHLLTPLATHRLRPATTTFAEQSEQMHYHPTPQPTTCDCGAALDNHFVWSPTCGERVEDILWWRIPENARQWEQEQQALGEPSYQEPPTPPQTITTLSQAYSTYPSTSTAPATNKRQVPIMMTSTDKAMSTPVLDAPSGAGDNHNHEHDHHQQPSRRRGRSTRRRRHQSDDSPSSSSSDSRGEFRQPRRKEADFIPVP